MRKLIFLQWKMISLAQGKIQMEGVSWRASVRRWSNLSGSGTTSGCDEGTAEREQTHFSLLPFSFVHLIFLRFLFLWSEIGLDIKEGSAHQSLLSSGATKIQILICSHVRVRVDEYSIFPLPFLSRALLRWFGLKAAEMRKGMRQRTGEGH